MLPPRTGKVPVESEMNQAKNNPAISVIALVSVAAGVLVEAVSSQVELLLLFPSLTSKRCISYL